MSHPFEGWSQINEGWDTGNPVETEDLIANLKTVARNFAGPVAITLVAFWAVKVLLSVLIGIVMIAASVAEVVVLFTVGGLLGYLGYLLLAVLSLAIASLYRPIQLQAFEGAHDDSFRMVSRK